MAIQSLRREKEEKEGEIRKEGREEGEKEKGERSCYFPQVLFECFSVGRTLEPSFGLKF